MQRWLYPQDGLWKWKTTYHFAENSAYFVLKEKQFLKTQLLDEQRVWPIRYHDLYIILTTNLIVLVLYMIWCIKCLWWLVVEWSKTKYWNRWRTWRGFCWRGFQLAKVKLDRYGEGGREVLRMGSCSINI